MESSTEIIVSFAQNAAMGDALQGKNIGDKVKIEVEVTVKELTPEGAVLSVEALVPEGYEVKEESTNAPTPASSIVGASQADTTIPTAMASRVALK